MARYKTKLIKSVSSRRNLTPLWIALAGLGLILFAFWTFWSSRQLNSNLEVAGQPKLRVDQELINYGDVRLGTTIRSEITLTNTGDQPLVFKRKPYVEVREGC